MTSTTRSEAATISSKSPRERVRTPLISGRIPVIAATWSARRPRRWAKAAPTVPWPRRPTRKEERSEDVTGHQVVVGLAAHHDAGVAAGGEDHPRARRGVG